MDGIRSAFDPTHLVPGESRSNPNRLAPTKNSREMRLVKELLTKMGAGRTILIAIWAVWILVGIPRGALPQSAEGATICGRVLDTAGSPLAGAMVRLKRGSDGPTTEKNAGQNGEFSFSGLEAGTYSLVAEKGGKHSAAIAVVASTSAPQLTVVVVLGDSKSSGTPGKAELNSSMQAMEFADNPNFTVAGVTDWTAAGGHGSDATLRTSEALNRETLSLKPTTLAKSDASLAGSAAKDAEAKLQAALANAPASFDANHQLGALYLHEGRYQKAVPLLQRALQINPADAGNEFDLALACKEIGDKGQAREHIEHVLGAGANADMHRLAGEIYEKAGEPLLAVHEFEKAVSMDPSEQNYFEWGTELLFHRAVWPAKDVFEQGVKAYPKSSRMLTSLGAVLFAGALYDQAELRLCEASDLNPEDPEPYLFMGKIEIAAPHPLECVDTRLARHVEMHPESALANYFYAMALWKQHGESTDPETGLKIEALLTKAAEIDPKCSDAYVQLGNLSSVRKSYAQAIGFYSKAIETNPQSSEAHYRLGLAYDRTGDRTKAQQEFALHDAIEKEQAAAVERQRKEIKQFVVNAPDKAEVPPSQ
jgi:tetratricopeptide (TPR) repeat protein